MKNSVTKSNLLALLAAVLMFFISPVHSEAKLKCVSLTGSIKPWAHLQSKAVRKFQKRLLSPKYKVIIMGRHARASAVNKYSSRVVLGSEKKAKKDKKRPLAASGVKGAKALRQFMGELELTDVGVWMSDAKRVKDTVNPVLKDIGDEVISKEVSPDLYYADVPKEMFPRLTSEEGEQIKNAIFWGHGSTTVALFQHLTGVRNAFLPTAGFIAVAVKADSWEDVFLESPEKIEAFMWSPENTHSSDKLPDGRKVKNLTDCID